jgi:YihY family inner membrane protein
LVALLNIPSLYRQILKWSHAEEAVRLPLRLALRWPWVFYRQLQEDRAFVRAAGMAYATLISLVPTLVIVYAVLSATGLGGADPDKALLLLFAPIFGELKEVEDFLLPGLQNVSLRALSLTGVATLLIVGARLFLMVERAYCDIFGVPVDRGFGVRILNFYFTLTAVPVVLGFTLVGTVEVMTGYGGNAARDVVVSLMQLGALVVSLKLFPSTQVRWGPALVGATTSWLLLELGGRLFHFYVIWIATDDPLRAVYGAMGLIPVFLFWLYMVWIFVLLGVEVANVMQNYDNLWEAELEQLERDRQRIRAVTVGTALQVAVRVAWHYGQGRGPVRVEELHQISGLRVRDIHGIAAVLVDAGILIRTEAGWLPAKPPEDVLLADVVAMWRDRTAVSGNDRAIADAVDNVLTEHLSGTLADAAERWLPTPPTPLRTATADRP